MDCEAPMWIDIITSGQKQDACNFFALQMRKCGTYSVKENKSSCNFPLCVLTKGNGKNNNLFSVSLDKKGVFQSSKDFVTYI